MTQQERNIEIAKMLGWKMATLEYKLKWCGVPTEERLNKLDPQYVPILMKENEEPLWNDTLSWDSNWNWLMDAVKFLTVHFDGKDKNFERVLDLPINSTKEEVFLVVSELAEYYNTKHELEKTILKFINSEFKECLWYKMNNELWLIKPNKQEWVVTVKNEYLWFNYDIFDNVFKLFGLDVFSYKVIIKNWVNDELGIKVGRNYEPNKIPREYDWSGDFILDNVISDGEIINI